MKTDSSVRCLVANLCVQGNQRRFRRRIRPVPEKAPVEFARERAHAFALRFKTAAISLARSFRAAENFAVARVAPFEAAAPAERKILFGRVHDLHQMTTKPRASHLPERTFDSLDRH